MEELFVEKEPQQPKNVQKCRNNCVNLLDLVQNLVKLTTEVLNYNSAINSKLDIVLRSNAKIEEYLLHSPKRFVERSDESRDNNIVCVESDSPKRITEIREQCDDTNTSTQNINNNQMRWGASVIQQTYNSLSSIGSDFPEQSADSLHPYQQQNIAEDCSPNCQQDWEEPDGHDSSKEPLIIIKECQQDWEEPDGHDSSKEPLIIIKEECSPSEDFKVISTLIAEKREDKEDEERAVIEAGMRRHSSSDFLGPSTFSTENAEDDEAKEAVKDNNFEFQEIKQEVELTTAGSEPESSIPVVAEGSKSNKDGGGVFTNVSVAARKKKRMRHSTKLDGEAQGNKIGKRYLGHKCDVCNKTFAQLEELQGHTCVDRHEAVHSCSVCHKTFKKSCNLKVHIRGHTGERPYRCSICSKAFIYSSNLKQHLEAHSGEGPYRCSVCNKVFGLSLSLKQHMKLHTGDCPHRCSFCGKEFCRSQNLKQHLRVHTGERPYRCSICNRAFTLFSSLHKHSRSHTGERAYERSKAFIKKSTEGAVMLTQCLTPMQL